MMSRKTCTNCGHSFFADDASDEHCDPCLDANARLIAAAPDLLAALELASAYIEEESESDTVWSTRGAFEALNAARSAIARARGTEPVR